MTQEKHDRPVFSVCHRTMNAVDRETPPGRLRVLDAVRWSPADGRPDRALVFSSAYASDKALHLAPPALLERRLTLQGSPVLSCRLPRGAPLKLESGLEIEAVAPEWPLFRGRNVLLALREGERPEEAADWLGYHARHHGMTGAVIVNRLGPEGQGREFATDLASLLGAGGPEGTKDGPLARRGAADAGAGAGPIPVMVLDCPIAIGRPDLPAAAHPFNAPDAPGKDRIELPPPDPWAAPLGEGNLWELVRWRFLAEAQAVANIDLSDLLVSPQAGPGRQGPDTDRKGEAEGAEITSSGEAQAVRNVFELALASRSGVMQLVGRRVYPWRVRKGRHPHYADHICHQFDSTSRNRRWCIDVARTRERAIWRLARIGNIAPDPALVGHFWRFMALRHPAATASELVPKTSLIESEDLLRLAHDVYGYKPVRQPRNAVHEPRREDVTIVTTMKNEGPFILEWLAYHRAIGVTNFLVYTNDCTDGTDTLLDLLQARGIVQHRDNPFRETGLKPQHAALQAAEKELVIREAGWIICMDVDEFINIHVGEGRLHDLFEAIGDANMISLTWRLFGNSDIHEYQDDFIIRQFTRCAPKMVRKPHQAWGFKTLFRNLGIFKKLGVHRPKGLRSDLHDEVRWVNGAGRPIPPRMIRNAWRSTVTSVGYDLVTLNHYAVRSAESFLVKRDRGRVNHVDRDQGLNYWFRMNHNAEEDRSIQRMLPALEREYAALMADPEIRAAHEHCVRKHREKIAELKARPDYAQFYQELTSPRMERLSRHLRIFGSAVFLSGPEVIPDELVEKLDELPPDFFFTVRKPDEAA